MQKKDKKIIEDSERSGIPIFVLTAKDANSTATLRAYKRECSGDGCDNDFLDAIQERIYEFDDWQNANQNKVKLPD